MECRVSTIEECKANSAKYKSMARDTNISVRQSNVLLNISRSWKTLESQLKILATVLKEEKK